MVPFAEQKFVARQSGLFAEKLGQHLSKFLEKRNLVKGNNCRFHVIFGMRATCVIEHSIVARSQAHVALFVFVIRRFLLFIEHFRGVELVLHQQIDSILNDKNGRRVGRVFALVPFVETLVEKAQVCVSSQRAFESLQFFDRETIVS
jgi:hypothetical protein